MPQYHSRKSALLALKRYFIPDARIEIEEGMSITPAEDMLLGALSDLLRERREQQGSQKFEYIREKAYRHLKSIARSARLWPISDEMITAYTIRRKMGSPTGILIENNGRKTKTARHHFDRQNRRSGRWEIILELPER